MRFFPTKKINTFTQKQFFSLCFSFTRLLFFCCILDSSAHTIEHQSFIRFFLFLWESGSDEKKKCKNIQTETITMWYFETISYIRTYWSFFRFLFYRLESKLIFFRSFCFLSSYTFSEIFPSFFPVFFQFNFLLIWFHSICSFVNRSSIFFVLKYVLFTLLTTYHLLKWNKLKLTGTNFEENW